jgi:asparagine synthase (glutamine-hydrolysing)
MGPEAAGEVARDFSAERWVAEMTGSLAPHARLALAQIEATTYLRNQLLRDSDWASMDHSVELRTPLVDAHLLDQLRPLLFAFARFPAKTLLSGTPAKRLPRDVLRRAKTGFEIPVGRWLDQQEPVSAGFSSREWARELVKMYSEGHT